MKSKVKCNQKTETAKCTVKFKCLFPGGQAATCSARLQELGALPALVFQVTLAFPGLAVLVAHAHVPKRQGPAVPSRPRTYVSAHTHTRTRVPSSRPEVGCGPGGPGLPQVGGARAVIADAVPTSSAQTPGATEVPRKRPGLPGSRQACQRPRPSLPGGPRRPTFKLGQRGGRRGASFGLSAPQFLSGFGRRGRSHFDGLASPARRGALWQGGDPPPECQQDAREVPTPEGPPGPVAPAATRGALQPPRRGRSRSRPSVLGDSRADSLAGRNAVAARCSSAVPSSPDPGPRPAYLGRPRTAAWDSAVTAPPAGLGVPGFSASQ